MCCGRMLLPPFDLHIYTLPLRVVRCVGGSGFDVPSSVVHAALGPGSLCARMGSQFFFHMCNLPVECGELCAHGFDRCVSYLLLT